MADTDFAALPATNAIQASDQLVVVRGGVPYRFAGALPYVDTSGRLGVGGVPSALISAITGVANDVVYLAFGRNGVPGVFDFYVNADGANWVRSGYGPLVFGTNTGNPASAAFERMRLDGAGNLLVGAADSAAYGGAHRIARTAPEGGMVLSVDGLAAHTVAFYGASQAGYSAPASAIKVGRNSTTGRSINAGGTINASGADFAEYMRKALAYIEAQIVKGQVLGVNADGDLTPRWSEAHSYVIKTYSPGVVGGDNYTQHLGPQPQAPAAIAPKPDLPVVPAAFDTPMPVRADGEPDDSFGLRMAEWLIESRAAAEALARHAAAVEAYPAALAAWTDAKSAFDAAMADYEARLPVWEAAMIEAKKIVDRVAFAGQVPVIVEGPYAPGQYLVAHPGADDTIVCRAHDLAELLADPALAYRKVGKVWAVRAVKRDPADESDAPEMVTRAWANVLHG